MDEPSITQKLAAEAFGTAFLVFIGVGSVPATIIVNGDAPFTMADLGMISFAFATVVVATIYALGHISGNHINPAVTLGLAVTGKFPWSRVPAYIAAQAVGAIIGAAAIIGVLGTAARDAGLGVATYSGECQSSTGLLRRIRGYVHSRVHRLRRDTPQGLRRDSPASPSVSSCSRRSSRWHPPRARRSTRPARSARCSSSRSPAAPSRGVSCRSTWPPSSWPASLAAFAYVAISRTRADAAPVAPSCRPRRPDHHRSLRSRPVKKLINDPADVISEALRGMAMAHPELRIDHTNRIIYRGDAPVTGKVGLISGGGLRARAAARRLRRAAACSTPPVPVRFSPPRCPTRCWRRPRTSTAARGCCTS